MQKAFLGWFQKFKDRRHNGPSNRGRQEPIITVGDTDGASVRDEAGSLLRDKEEKAFVEVGRRRLARRDRFEDCEEDRGSKVRGRTPSSEGDTIRAGGRVVSMVNREDDVIEGDIVAERKINFLGVTT